MKKFLGLRGKHLNWAISAVAGCDFLLFGYGKLFLQSPTLHNPIQNVRVEANN